MKYSIQNEELKISVLKKGAELCSVIKNEKEYIWQADPQFWGAHGPLLFPIVGRIHDDQIQIGGHLCTMPTHGFLSQMEFRLVEHDASKIVLETEYTEETIKQYPYKFKVIVTYRINGTALEGRYQIRNLDERVMPYGFGLHNGFNCLESNGEDITDIYLEFDKPITIEKPSRTEDDFMIFDEPIRVLEDESRLYLTDEWYPRYAPVIESVPFHSFRLCHKKRGCILKYSFSDNFELFNAWRAPGSSFICLEPWSSQCGIFPYANTLEEVKNTKYLSGGDEVTYTFNITL